MDDVVDLAPPEPPTAPEAATQVDDDPSEDAAPATAPRRWRVPTPRGPALMLAAAVAAGAVAGGVAGRLTADNSSTTRPIVIPRGTGTLASPKDIQQVLARIQPAVVAVRTQANRRGPFFSTQGAGTGTILTSDGEVLTNAHVVDGASTIQVTLNGEDDARTADVIGTDPVADIALLKIRDAKDLPTATLGRSADLQVGDTVIAIGNALNLGATPTITEGIVSALDRSIGSSTERLRGLIQTDAAINPGNSGGPLVDAQGRVVGMTTAIAGNGQNIGFALAIDGVKTVLDEVRQHPGTVTRAFLGVSVEDAADGGAAVREVTSGAPADKGGLKVGDVITKVGDDDVESADDLITAVQSHRPGDSVEVTYERGGDSHTAKVELGRRPAATG